jgi:hypothetical protein
MGVATWLSLRRPAAIIWKPTGRHPSATSEDRIAYQGMVDGEPTRGNL